MRTHPSRPEIQKLADKVWHSADNQDSEYGDYVFLLPGPTTGRRTGSWLNVSIDGRHSGGAVALLPVTDFSARIVDIEYPHMYPEVREILTLSLAAELGNLLLNDMSVQLAETDGKKVV